LKAWAVPRLRALVDNSGLLQHKDTLERLVAGDFRDLTPAERSQRVEEIIGVSAGAAVGMAAVPIPFLDLPVLMTMVGAIGRVHGADQSDNRLWYQVLGVLGGGMVLRQVLRMVPFGGQLYAAQMYGATWALGRTAELICTNGAVPTAEDMKKIFEETLRRKADEHGQKLRKAPGTSEARLRDLANLRDKNLITEAEYEKKRAEILASV
jgi:uncharacterized protein (DUF697 family)